MEHYEEFLVSNIHVEVTGFEHTYMFVVRVNTELEGWRAEAADIADERFLAMFPGEEISVTEVL